MALESVSAEAILSCLKTRVVGRNLVYRSRVSSTMDVARDEVLRGAPHGTTILAEIQEHGKGRLNRGWISPYGGVYMSIIIYPPEALVTALTMISSLAVVDGIADETGIPADIKWPNDILIYGKKVAGIMAVSGVSRLSGCYAIVGIGLNVNMDLTTLTEITATTLSAVTYKPLSRQEMICNLLENFEKRYLALLSGEPLWQEWQRRLVTLGKRVSVKCGKGVFQGIAESVNQSGSLLLREADGGLVVIPAGDVTLRV